MKLGRRLNLRGAGARGLRDRAAAVSPNDVRGSFKACESYGCLGLADSSLLHPRPMFHISPGAISRPRLSTPAPPNLALDFQTPSARLKRFLLRSGRPTAPVIAALPFTSNRFDRSMLLMRLASNSQDRRQELSGRSALRPDTALGSYFSQGGRTPRPLSVWGDFGDISRPIRASYWNHQVQRT